MGGGEGVTREEVIVVGVSAGCALLTIGILIFAGLVLRAKVGRPPWRGPDW